MGKFVKAVFFVFSLLVIMGLFSIVAAPPEALSQEVKTTIDLKYSSTESNEDGDIINTRELDQKYDIEYKSALGHFYDFSSKISVDNSVTKKTREATTKNLSPELDLQLKSDSVELESSYSGDRDFTGATQDAAEVTAYKNQYLFEAKLKPKNLPETTLKWEREREFEKQAVDRISNKFDLELKHEFKDFGAEFNFSKSKDKDILPETVDSETLSWEGNLDYGRSIYKNLDLQVEYNIKEEVIEDHGVRGVFVSRDKTYKQNLKTALKSNFNLMNQFDVKLAYDFDFEQDFMEEEFENTVNHKITGEVSKEFLRWASANLKYEGTNEKTNNIAGDDDEEMVKNKITGEIKVRPYNWLDAQTKAEREYITEIKDETGRTVYKDDARKYETTVTTKYGDKLKLSGTHGYEEIYTDDFLDSKETKYKFKGDYQLLESFKIEPRFEISLEKNYHIVGSSSHFNSKTRTWDSEIKFTFEKKWLEVFQVKADHTFGYKKKQELDEVLNLVEETDLKEDSKFAIKVKDWIRGMTLDVEVSRKADDTLDDDEPMIVDRTLSVKFEWMIRNFNISSSYKFDEKGDADNTLKFSTKVSWRQEFYEIIGQYEFDKTFSEEIDEENKYDVQLKLVF